MTTPARARYTGYRFLPRRNTPIFAPRGDMAAAFSPIMIVGAWVQAFNAAGMIEALANTPSPEANVSVLRKNLAAAPLPCGEPISVATGSSYDSPVEGAGFEPSVPLRAPGVLVVSVLVLCRLSVSGESSSGDMSPSRNLGCVTRYRRFESGFLKRRVHVSRRPGRCRVENRGFGSPSPFEWCIQHPRAAPQSGSVSDEPACTTVPAGHRV